MTPIVTARHSDNPMGPSRPHARVLAVIVNHNGADDTLACVASLQRSTEPVDVLVVDNRSDDGSARRIREAETGAHLVETPRNVGFAGGCNVGLRWARAAGFEFVWLLNNDTVVESHAAATLIAAALARDDAGFVGSWITREPERDRLWFVDGRYEPLIGRITHLGDRLYVGSETPTQEIQPTGWVSGCSMLVPLAKLEFIGLLDEDYFLYCEEVEWQVRARSVGVRAYVVTRPLVHHRVSASVGRFGDELRITFCARNRLRLLFSQAGVRAPLWALVWILGFILRPLAHGRLDAVVAALRGVRYLYTPGTVILERHLAQRRGLQGAHPELGPSELRDASTSAAINPPD